LVLSAADVLGSKHTMNNGIEFVDLVSRKECKSYINHDGYTILWVDNEIKSVDEWLWSIAYNTHNIINLFNKVIDRNLTGYS